MIYILAGIIAYLILCIMLQNREHRNEREAWQRERSAEHGLWLRERQQLIDRIQAPSFDHLKQAEIRMEKAKNEPKETIKLEVV